MQIFTEAIQFSIDRACEVTREYKLRVLNADASERSVDGLIDVARHVLGKTIHLKKLDIDKEDTSTWGACFAYDTHYDVCTVDGLNYCWTRFIYCKEVFHAILDRDEYRNVSLCAHIDEAVSVFPDPEYSAKPSTAVMAEKLAEIAAMEFLFPYTRRKQELEKDGSVNYQTIAERYRVPLVLVERYLSAVYMEPLGKFKYTK
jgi:Zn-dependent peptidase ImmA (M78 family)